MSNTQHTFAPQRPRPERIRRTSAVISQYIQDLSDGARAQRPRQLRGAREPGVFPARVVPVPCS
jgi:hypothetical protein